jgi:8-amino-7-oxononanoate synthase
MMHDKPVNQIALLDEKGYFSFPAEKYFKNREFQSDGKRFIDFCSTSYLHFDYEEEIIERGLAFVREWGITTQWSRIEADACIHPELEKKIADFVGTPRILLGHTITSTNYSHIPSIAKGGIIFTDRSLHTVVWEACRLARDHGAQIIRFNHQDLNHLEDLLKQHAHVHPKVIAVDGIYSVSTELAPLSAMQELCERYNAWLYIDDAHGFGIAGKNPSPENPYGVGGAGLVHYFGGSFDRTFYVANFNKAFCVSGAFTTIPVQYKDNMKAYSTQHIFSAPMSPFIIGAIGAALDMNARVGEERRAKIRVLVDKLCAGLRARGVQFTNHISHPVVFVEIGAFEKLLNLGDLLFKQGLLVGFRAFPLVPSDQTGIRIAVTAGNTEEHIDKLLDFFNR